MASGNGTGIGEFYISLFVDAADGVLTVGNLVKGLGMLEVATVAEIGLLWELGLQLAKVTDEGIKASLGFEQFTMHTGLSAQELQKWQIVARQAHASADDVTGSAEALTKKLADMGVGGTGGGALGALQQLFIAPFGPDNKVKGAFQILDEVRQRLGLIKDAGQQERILGALGISPNLRETLLLTQTQFETMGAAAHGMTAQQEAAFDAMRQHFVRIHLIAQDISSDIGAWVAHLDKASGALDHIEALFRGIRSVLEGKTEAFKLPELDPGQKPNERRFDQSLIYKLFFEPHPTTNPTFAERLLGVEPSAPAAAAAGPAHVTIDKHDTYNIYDAHDPEKVRAVIEKHWDETLGKKTIDGFDRQNNNGGF